VAVVVSAGAPVTTVGVSPLTKPVVVDRNVGTAAEAEGEDADQAGRKSDGTSCMRRGLLGFTAWAVVLRHSFFCDRRQDRRLGDGLSMKNVFRV
jgi:hypothetical protein